MHRNLGFTTCVIFAAAGFAVAFGSAHAQTAGQTTVDLELVLAVDVSGSITSQRWQLEQEGYAQAFHDPEVLKAIQSGPVGAIAVTLVEWSSEGEEEQVIPWQVVRDQDSADMLSATLAELPRVFHQSTSIREGIRYSAQLIAFAPYDAARRVIDVSGDGPDNTTSFGSDGSPQDAAALRSARDRVIAQGITINGLPIVGAFQVTNLDQYYMENVIGGPESFMIVAQSFETFGTAIQRKLVEEIAQNESRDRAVILASR